MEDRVIEYKRELTKDIEGLEREVVSFLNSNGGELLIGVNNDGTVYGVDEVDAVQTKIAQRLDSNIKPSCLGLFDIHVERREDKRIIKVVVSAGSERPYYLTKYGMTSKGCYYRVGASCRQMSENKIMDLYKKRVPRTIANIESPDQDLTFQVLEIYYRRIYAYGSVCKESRFSYKRWEVQLRCLSFLRQQSSDIQGRKVCWN